MEIIAKINNEEALFKEISLLIEESRKKVAKAVNTAMVYTYYKIGCYIVEYEQQGSNRASYGRKVLANLSAHLTETYGKGWSVTTLNNCRKFYSAYRISCAMHTKFQRMPTSMLRLTNIICQTRLCFKQR